LIRSLRARMFALPALLTFLAAQGSPRLPFGPWHRVSDTPVIAPRGNGWEAAGTFNPAVAVRGDKIVMLYRAQDKQGTSRLGYAESRDGIHFNRRDQPVLSPTEEYEKDGGVEDPRLVQFGETYYLTYTGYNKKDAQLGLATSKDLIHWNRKGVIIPAYKGNWTEATQVPVLPVRPDRFDSRVAEPGPAPIVTPDGIVLIYNGADDKLVYRTGIAIFDRNDPRKLLWRSDEPVFWPEKDWEKIGQVPNVVFVEGMLQRGDRYLFYYGGADTNVGIAQAPVNH
jgi:predicted GH43/DUF377 family glycosyl hydrolase